MEITVLCMHWGEWCKPYKHLYINNLYHMLKRHTSIPFKMVCGTDALDSRINPDIEIRIIPNKIMHWMYNLKKFWMYSPDNGLTGRIVFIDLDSVIIGNMDDMLSYSGEWCGIKAFKPQRKHTGGGLISFDKDSFTAKRLWKKVSSHPAAWAKATTGGSERYVYKALLNDPDTWQILFPGQLVSYKRQIRTNRELVPKNARFIAFHGNPRPHMLIKTHKFVEDNWK